VTDRKTLQIRSPAEQAATPPIKKRGRGWEISDKRLDVLHERAREMRRNPSEAHQALAKRFATANLGRYKFTQHTVIGSAIVNFNCHIIGMAIAIDEEGEDEAIARRRDKSLEAVGIRVMRIKATDILENLDEVLLRITAGMRQRIENKREAAHAHKAANPRLAYSRPKRPTNARD
jgi:very-short-patch-repair endonuclease